MNVPSFREYNLIQPLQTALVRLKINEPTKIQAQALPLLLAKHSAIITSQTGSGKTLCYLLPTLNNLDYNDQQTQCIVLLPTKELAKQIYSKYYEFKLNLPSLRLTLCTGGSNWIETKYKLKKNPSQIVIGTISKVHELIKEKIINAQTIKMVVFDEVDMLIDHGFINLTNDVLQTIDHRGLQKIACSATTHESLANWLKKYFKDTKVVSANRTIWSNENINHHIIYDHQNNPLITLLNLLKNLQPYFCIIFANTRKIASEVYQTMLEHQYNCVLLHKDLSTRQRKTIFKAINKNQYQYLIASDLASRGIDIQGADVIISIGLPEDDVWYMHRAGRVGRYKTKGDSFVIYTKNIDPQIARLTKKNINFHYQFINQEGKLINKPLKLRKKQPLRFDDETNHAIKKIVWKYQGKVQPGYKKKMKTLIKKIKQKKRHEFIDQKIKANLIKNYRIKNSRK